MKTEKLNEFFNFIEKQDCVGIFKVTQATRGSPGKKGFKMAVTPDGLTIGSIGGGIMEKNLIDSYVKNWKEWNTEPNSMTLHHRKEGLPTDSGLMCSGSQVIEHFKIVDKKIIQKLKKQEVIDDLWIFGAGHVGSALKIVGEFLGFHVTVLDDRMEPLEKNKYKTKNRLFIAIVSHNIDADIKAVKLCLDLPYHYLGVMGTKVKIHKIFETATGDKNYFLNHKKIKAPIASFIKSETAQEIAVAIGAELIAVRNMS